MIKVSNEIIILDKTEMATNIYILLDIWINNEILLGHCWFLQGSQTCRKANVKDEKDYKLYISEKMSINLSNITQ